MKKLSEKDQLVNRLVEVIAKDLYEAAEEFYKDAKEDYAADGVTKAMYMAGDASEASSESIDNLFGKMENKIHRAYEQMVMKNFPRVKKSDFIWY